MFLNILDDIPHKWYKIEEASGHTFDWNKIKNNFLKDFEFNPKEILPQEETRETINFLGKTSPEKIQEKGKTKVDQTSTSTCNSVSTHNIENIISLRVEMSNISFSGQRFRWKKNHPGVENFVKPVYSMTK